MPKILEIESTPNPNAKKFVLKEPLTHGLARSFESAAKAKDDPLATALFAIPHVTNVYYIDNWLTVTQDGSAPWDELLRQLAPPIRVAEASVGITRAEAEKLIADTAAGNPIDAERLAQINALLDQQVRPALMRDGGGLEIVQLDGNQLKVHYQGACGSCPTSLFGTLAAIENLLHTIEPELELIPV